MKILNSNGNSFTSRNRCVLFGALTFILLAYLAGTLVYQRFLIKKESKRDATYSVLVATKEKFQELLVQSLSATRTLSFFIQADGTVKNFDQVAAQILATTPSIDVLELVPGGTISYIYPLAGSEQALGYNILKDTARNKEAFKAIKRNQLFFAGPFALKQGGLAVVGRLPVYRNKQFWGFSAAVIKMSTLLKSAGIDAKGGAGYYFQLSKKNPDSQVEEFFIPQPEGVNYKNNISVEIPSGEWTLAATPVDETKGFIDILWLAILGMLFSVMGTWIVIILTKRRDGLNNLVNKRTAELAESEEKYRSFIEQASDGIIVYSPDGTIHQFNMRAYVETGYTKEEFRKLRLTDLLAKELIVHTSGADGLHTGETAMIERKLVKKDGSLVDVEINLSKMPDATLLAFVRDITDRKNAEIKLKESEQKFSRIFQSDLLGLAIYNDDNTLTEMNECFASMLGSVPQELTGRSLSEMDGLSTLPDINMRRILDSIVKIQQIHGPLKNQEIELQKKDGQPLFLLVSVELLELNHQQNWLIAAIDITTKKNAELSLMKNEMKYRSLIEQASDGIVITDLSGTIVEVNKSICDMGGFDGAEMTGTNIDSFLPIEDVTELPFRIQDLVLGKTLFYERRIQKKDGTIIDVEVNSKMAIGNTLISFVRDITERKRSEEQLIQSNERFELIAKATNDAIWDHDFTTNETVGNEKLYNLYGFTQGKDKVNFTLFVSRLHRDDRGRIVKQLNKAIEEKAVSVSEEFRFRTTENKEKHFYIRAYIKYDDNDKPKRILGVMQDVTGRIKDRQRLLKEKELSDSIINSLPAVFYLYNQEGAFLRWNKNFETVTGYTSEEIKKLHPLNLFDEEEKLLLQEKINNVFISGEDNVEANFLLKNKQKIPYYFSGMKIDYEGEICLMGFGLDFSDKAKSEKFIKESEQKFRGLVEQASEGVKILSETGKPLYLSPAVERILGYMEGEIMQSAPFEYIHPDDVAPFEKVLEQVMKYPGLPVKGHIYRVLHKDGTWRWLEGTFTNMMHMISINGIVENFRDITEKLQIEKTIINEKELSDSIINNLPGIFYLHDFTGQFIRWNKNLETITGYSAEEIKQMHPLDFYEVDQRRRVRQRIKTLFKNNLPDEEFFLLTKNRKRIPFYYNSIVIEYEGVPCIAGMAFDMTDRKKIEQQLLISNKNLAQKAEELKTSYVELERFAYIVSHDLQEPLRMISSFLKLLHQKYQLQLDDTAQKYIHFAVDGADRMKQLIMDLLEYSRTGTNKDVPEDTDMNEVVTDVLEVFRNPILEQKAVVEFGHLPVLPATSKVQMFQLMQNLLGNALKYHSDRPLKIKIDAKEENDHWIFSINDNGIGIDPRFAEKIFIIFQRLHNRDEFSGTGIGLSICKKIVEKHGGKIWVEPAMENGSTFYFSIPKK